MFGGAFPQADHLEARLASLTARTVSDQRQRARAVRAPSTANGTCARTPAVGRDGWIPAWTCRPRSGIAIVGLAQSWAHLESTRREQPDHVLVIGTDVIPT